MIDERILVETLEQLLAVLSIVHAKGSCMRFFCSTVVNCDLILVDLVLVAGRLRTANGVQRTAN